MVYAMDRRATSARGAGTSTFGSAGRNAGGAPTSYAGVRATTTRSVQPREFEFSFGDAGGATRAPTHRARAASAAPSRPASSFKAPPASPVVAKQLSSTPRATRPATASAPRVVATPTASSAIRDRRPAPTRPTSADLLNGARRSSSSASPYPHPAPSPSPSPVPVPERVPLRRASTARERPERRPASTFTPTMSAEAAIAEAYRRAYGALEVERGTKTAPSNEKTTATTRAPTSPQETASSRLHRGLPSRERAPSARPATSATSASATATSASTSTSRAEEAARRSAAARPSTAGATTSSLVDRDRARPTIGVGIAREARELLSPPTSPAATRGDFFAGRPMPSSGQGMIARVKAARASSASASATRRTAASTVTETDAEANRRAAVRATVRATGRLADGSADRFDAKPAAGSAPVASFAATLPPAPTEPTAAPPSPPPLPPPKAVTFAPTPTPVRERRDPAGESDRLRTMLARLEMDEDEDEDEDEEDARGLPSATRVPIASRPRTALATRRDERDPDPLARRRAASARAGAKPVMDISEVSEGGSLPGYLLGKVVGEGGFCKVRAGVHQVTGAKVAIKLIDKTRLTDPADRKRVGREIRVLKRLAHPNVIRLFDVAETSARIYCIMEYADGGSLLDYVRRRKRLPEAEAAKFAYQTCLALDRCHRSGVAHRDVKLENLLLDARNDIKLIDFGLSAVLAPGKKLKVHCGSPSYAAPEIVARKSYDGPPVDVWSMGVVTFAMVTGYLPFYARGNNKQELCQKILKGHHTLPEHASKDFRDVISVILRVDPERRATVARCLDSRWFRQAADAAADRRDTYPAAPSGASLDQNRLESLEAAGLDRGRLVEDLRAAEHNYHTAAYHLLAYRDSAAEARDVGAEREAAAAAAAAKGGSSANANANGRADGTHDGGARARAHSARAAGGRDPGFVFRDARDAATKGSTTATGHRPSTAAATGGRRMGARPASAMQRGADHEDFPRRFDLS